ncbi:hypothetical protein BBO99_00009304 [Phytophthora kernoviae]|uniref:MYND-type domain-containing protein n=2 Tax=Phytophthora kernoviae TaxID=325452 RepID=A0A3R7JX03_9STRA|nr:hypothetical protein G195_010946 [Phytophthora kernoviae 00238/432]KAG2508246.1 hypothetical protein JM18_009217 [Phytophthora kernoviae]RLN27227.1 hypothetical protein BBI17_009337 [Phytophthora kernoviae]RLN73649.1 hypothetical protein BBO99_00009304 [Phytophthora kernoviae]
MAETGDTSIESLANNAIAAGCLQAVMSLVHPELAKFVSFQRERVGKTDAEQNKRSSSSSSRHSRRRSDAPEPSDGGGSRSQNQQMDLSYQLKYLRQHWHSHLRYYGLDPELPAVVQRALMYRNKVSHQSQMNLDQYQVAIATFQKLAELIECNALIRQQIKELVAKLLSFSPLSTHQTTPEDEENEVRTREKEYQESVKPLVATAEQMQQYNFFNDEDEEPLWVELKLIGNDYFKERNYSEAVEAYSQALEAAPHEAVLYGNRSMCHLRLKEYDLAREDAEDAMDEDGGDNIKYYRLLSEALMGLKEYREAKEICDQGLELDPKDEVLLSRRDKAESMAEIERLRSEQEKKKREQEERAKLAAANAATATLAQEQTEGETAKQKKKSKKNKVKLKKTAPDLELAPMINYQEVSTKLIEVHTRGSKQLEVYSQGMQYMVIAAEALVQVTDSIGEPGRSRLPLDELVSEGIANLHKAGEAGVAEAWFRLGVLYSSTLRKGIPLNPDPHKTICYLNKAAACRPFIKPPGNRVFPHHGVAEAENELGVCYRDGKPAPVVEADPEKAFQFFLSSAEHDFPMGQYNVSVAYTIGFGTAADAFAARLWASRAAQHGLPEGQQHLAELLEKGVGGKRDAKQAREWSLIASQSRLTDLVLKHDFADVGVTPINNVYEEYVSTNPPDERFVPDAYYALGALYFKKYDTAKAVIYHELGQMAESVATRFPAFHPRVHVHIPKETLRSSMKMHGYMESSVIANVIAQNMAECGFCKCRIKPTQLLNHKMSKCPRRIIVCQVCSVDMVFDDLHAHKQFCVSTNQNTQPSPNGVSKQTTASKNDNAQPNLKKSAGAQVLTKPNCHFAGTILEISQGKSATKPTVFTLQTVVGQRWTLRLNRASQLVTESTVAAETLKALNGAVAQNTLLVFWRTSPSLDMIDRRALTVPMGNDVYGQDVIIYVLQCSVQTLSFELRELRNNMHIKKGPLCSSCNCSPLAGGNLSTCGACKVVKYCSRECQRIHWKRVHRYMCQDPVLLGNCNSLSEDITPYERSVPAKKEDAATYKMYKAAKKGRSDSVDHGSMLGILEDIVETVRSSGDGIDPNVNEHYMLPSCNPLRPDKIQGSVRVFKQAAPSKSGKKEFIVQFSIGYLASLPTPAQQQELHYFFQIPPHNPMQLKHGGMEVYLEDCKALTDDASGSGFRMMMEVPLAKFPVPALAELLDYLRTNTNMYLS